MTGMMEVVSPNKPKTPVSNFRIPVAVKARAQERARRDGKSLTDVVVEMLTEYASEPIAAPTAAERERIHELVLPGGVPVTCYCTIGGDHNVAAMQKALSGD